MFKKLIYCSCILLVLCITSSSRAELVAYYGMEDGSGSTVTDDSGNGYDGTTDGSPTWVAGPDGFGTALNFAGATSGVECGTFDPTVDGKVSFAFWAYFEGTGGDQYQGLICKNGATQMFMTEVFGDSGGIYWNSSGTDDYGLTTLTEGEWVHIAIVHDNANATTDIYRNGEYQRTSNATWDDGASSDGPVRIGTAWGGTGFYGAIDEVYFFNSLLTADEVVEVMNGTMKPGGSSAGLAKKPSPGNKSPDISIDVGTLAWTPGEFVAADGGTHNVFFGTDEASVAAATTDDPMGTTTYLDLDVNSVDIARLEYDTTYYWRVDEVNLPANAGTSVGKVWNFSTEAEGIDLTFDNIVDVTADTLVMFYPMQEPNMTCNESGLDANDAHSSLTESTMWLGYGDNTWIQYEFDQIYKFHEILVWNYNEPDPGQLFGAKNINVLYSQDGVNWDAVADVPEINVGTGMDGYEANTIVPLNGAIGKYIKIEFVESWMYSAGGGLSEVRFSVIPTRAMLPDPEDESEGIEMDQVLSWKAGRDSDMHTVYIGSDPNEVKAGNADIIADTDEAMYSPVLALGKTYYWKVDEVNDNEAFSTWDGPVWSFSTVESILVEGFEEGYDDSDVNAVFMTWVDGYGIDENGSVMGNVNTPYLSEDAHSGDYSSPLSYDHSSTANYSEVTADAINLPIATSDWSIGSPEALVIWFSGDANNVPAQMYVKLNDTKVLYDDDPIYLTKSTWRPWVINLSDVSEDISDITSISIGFEETGNQNEVGTILIDDISLYGIAPEIAEAVDPGTDGLVASYLMENNVQDSSGNGLHGTLVGEPTYVSGISGYGMALEFEGGDSNDCVNLGLSDPNEAFNFEGSFSVSLWAKIADWSTSWGDVMIGNRGESNIGWQIRRGSGLGNNGRSLCFTTRGVDQDDMTSNVVPPLDEWIHITCVYDSEAHTKTIYYNGIMIRTVTLNIANTKVPATTHNTYIGARASSGNTPEAWFTGQLDEIYVYERALSAGEAVYLSDPTP